MTDITRRKKAEEALKTSEENFRHSLDDSPLSICIVNADEKTIYANLAMLTLYGFNSLEQLEALPLSAIPRRATPDTWNA